MTIKINEVTIVISTDIKVAVCTVIWVSDRIDVPELSTAKSQFGWKYGGKFVKECMDKDALVNERVKTKLKVEPPPGYMVNEYLKNIAKVPEIWFVFVDLYIFTTLTLFFFWYISRITKWSGNQVMNSILVMFLWPRPRASLSQWLQDLVLLMSTKSQKLKLGRKLKIYR